jgi:hypothetical protein
VVVICLSVADRDTQMHVLLEWIPTAAMTLLLHAVPNLRLDAPPIPPAVAVDRLPLLSDERSVSAQGRELGILAEKLLEK